MTLYDFIEMAVANHYECYVWDINKEEIVFEGILDDIPDELLECEIVSWEVANGRFGFNID